MPTTTITSPTFTSLQTLPTSKFEGKSTNGLDNGELRVVRNGDAFQLVGLDDSGKITWSTGSSVRAYAATATGVPSALTWSDKQVMTADAGDPSLSYTSKRRMGVVVVSEATVAFWVDQTNNLLYARRFIPGKAALTNDWCQVMIPQTVNGAVQFQPVTVPGGGVSATNGFDEQAILVSYLVVDGNGTRLRNLNLDFREYQSEQHRWSTSGAAWDLRLTSPPITSSTYGKFDVRTLLARVPVGDGSETFLLAGVWDEQNHKISALAWSIAKSTMAGNPERLAAIPLLWPNNQSQRAGDGIILTIDPAGRLLVAFGDTSNHGDVTFGLIADLSPLGNTSVANLSFSVVKCAFSGGIDSNNQDSESPLSLVFVVSDQARDRTAVPSQYPVLCTAFWITSTATTANSTAQLVTAHYADAMVDQKVYPPPPQDDYNKKLFVGTVCDPFPIPQPSKSLWGNSTPDGMADWLLFEYAFLNGQSHLQVVNNEWKVGLTISGEKAWAGLYVGGSLGGGAQFATSDSISVSTSQGMKIETKAYFNPLIPADGSVYGPYAIRPYGSYLSRSVYALRQVTYTIMNLAFTPAGSGAPVVLPSYSAIVDKENEETITGDFFAYAVVPGDIRSYFEQNINYRMAYLYKQMTKNMTAEQIAEIFTDYDEDGKPIDLTVYYTGGNYVADVIRDFGVVLDVDQDGRGYDRDSFTVNSQGSVVAKRGSKGRKFVPFALSGGSVSDGTYTVRRGHSFSYGGFIDFELYVGYSWGSTSSTPTVPLRDQVSNDIEEGYLGDSEDAPVARSAHESYVQAKLNFSWNIMSTGTDEDTTAISMNVYYNSLSAGQALAARLYAFRPSRLWAIELAYFPELARSAYLAGLQHTATTYPQPGVTVDSIAANPDIAQTISNASSLLIEQSVPSRYMLVVSNWDSANYPMPAEFAITAYYPEDPAGIIPAVPVGQPHNTGAGGGLTDRNYLVGGQPAILPASRPSAWVAAQPGSAWISLPTGNFYSQPQVVSEYVTEFMADENPESMIVSGRLAADDHCSIAINGILVQNPYNTGHSEGAGYGSLTPFTLTGPWQTGINTITFKVNNSGGGPTGLLVVFDPRT